MSKSRPPIMVVRALPCGLVLQGEQGSVDDPVLQEPLRVAEPPQPTSEDELLIDPEDEILDD